MKQEQEARLMTLNVKGISAELVRRSRIRALHLGMTLRDYVIFALMEKNQRVRAEDAIPVLRNRAGGRKEKL